jgi:hypothetical protein
MKKLLVRLLPKPIVTLIVKQKYKTHNIAIHKENIKENKLVSVECKNQDKYNFLKSTLKKSFGGVIKIDKYSFYFHPIAIIEKPKTIEEYLQHIGAKSRNMNKKAEKNGIACDIFEWNERLEEIFEINTSSMYRQGRQMDKSYQQFPQKIEIKDKEDFKIRHIGAFKEDKLIGYIELYIYGNFAMTNRILGHKEFLKYGVMNLMIKKCVEFMIEQDIKYLNYLTMQNRQNSSLSAFKYRVGFREYSLLELK